MDNGTELSNCANECSNKLSSSGVQWSKNSFACCWFCKDARPWRLSNDDNLFLFFQRQKKKKRDGGGGGVNACCFRRRKRILRPPRRIIDTLCSKVTFPNVSSWAKKQKKGLSLKGLPKEHSFLRRKNEEEKKISVEKNLLLQVPCRAFSTKQQLRFKNLAPLETAFHAFCRRHDDVTMPTLCSMSSMMMRLCIRRCHRRSAR